MARRRTNSLFHTIAAYITVGGLLLVIVLLFASSRSISKNGITLFNRAASTNMSIINGWGNAVLYSGDGSFIQGRNTEALNPGFGFTAETWFRLNIVPGIAVDKNMTLVNKINYNDESFLLNLHLTSDDGKNFTLGYFWVVNNANYNCQSDWTISSNKTLSYIDVAKWQHIAGVIQQDGTLNLYINGQREEGSIGSVTGTCNSGAPYRIGAVAFGTRRGYFDGQIDEVRISNVARYQNSFTPSYVPFIPDGNTLFLYHMDEQNGTTYVHDATNNMRQGDIIGKLPFTTSSIPSPLAGSSK